MRQLFLSCLLPLLTGCCTAGLRPAVYSPTAHSGTPPAGVIFIANGSGDFRTVSANLSQVVAETATPLQIETLVWSRGLGRYVTDHVDHGNHLAQGRLLAAHVVAYRRAFSGHRVYLVGHSAGCAVILAAAEALPTDSLDRILLLAPSVCVSYDLRPALRTARRGIDAFHSSEDNLVLGLCMRLIGTAEGGCYSAAGQRGFTPVLACPGDATLYTKLRQHPWDPAVAWSGNDGGHYGSNQAAFLRAYVLPLLTDP